ncbi:hypothetical protein [Tessaracoccus flavescens]|nr:hypothetical protein [Tessaracoccus flavescens]
MLIEDVEKLVEDYYTRVQITPAQQDALAGMLHHEFDRLMAAETEELARLTANRDRLEREQDRLMQAHYADAIPLSVLKREQDRIVAELDQVTRRIDAHFGDYADARAHLDDALGLLANCADIYARCDDTNRRLCNQAFFTRVFIDEDNELRVEHNRPFEMLLDPQVNANALTWAADMNKARTSANVSIGKGSSLVRGVDLRSSFSNPRKPLGSLISRVLRGSGARRPRARGARMTDERGPMRENSRQSQTRLSVSNRAELIAGYADGVPVRELATRFNVHRGTVREIARQAGLAARRPELPDAIRQDAAQLYAGGMTLAQVAARLGVSHESVRSAVIACGGTIRAGGRRRVTA